MSKLVQKINSIEHKLQKNFQPLNVIEVSRSAILNNFDELKTLHKGFEVLPVLKSNAYGHGLAQVAEILKDRKFPYIAVDGYFEALKIRTVSKQPILIMGAIYPTNFKNLHINNYAFAVGDMTQLHALGKLNKKIKIHLDINTGMNRQGFEPSEVPAVMRTLKQYKKLELEGVMSHLADADNPRSQEYSDMQITNFDLAIEKIIKAGSMPKYIHLSNSPGSAKQQSQYANTIRPGLALYGLNPLQKGDKQRRRYAKLQPALQLKSSIIKIINLKPGDRVSYNGTFTAKRKTRVAVLPLGYYEGISREFSNNGWVSCRKSWFRYVGKICMNHTIVEIGSTSTKVFDSVLVISRESKDRNSVQSLCAKSGVFNYAFVAGLNQTIHREIVA